jgi:uncharacterized protein YdeI (YjbR/CyaY-like superfamily)
LGKRDARVDAYIAKSPDFAKPILTHVRALVHDACPDVEETMKWSVPHFDYRGVLCGMAAFKQHCNIILWKGGLIRAADGRDEKGQFRNITSVSDLPSDKTMKALLKQAVDLNERGVKAPRVTKKKEPLPVPSELKSALKKNKKASAVFAKFSPSNKREYAEWINDAKGADTRQRRVETAVEWIAEGKSRHWKYQKR